MSLKLILEDGRYELVQRGGRPGEFNYSGADIQLRSGAESFTENKFSISEEDAVSLIESIDELPRT